MNEIIESTPTPLSDVSNEPILKLTLQAQDYIKSYLTRKPELSDQHFRVSVEGGGCSGYQYNFTFDTIKQDDLVINQDDVLVLVDPQSKLFLKGSTIDYKDDFRGSGFTVLNPNSKGSCGCGVSFTV